MSDRPTSAGVRYALKQAAETILGNGLVTRLSRTWRSGQRLLLAFHNVVPQGAPSEGDRSLHCSFDQFRRHLDLLQARHPIRSLEQALAPGSEETMIAITFDDAYAGAVLMGLPELSGRGIPATMFVAPGLLGAGVPWWDAIAGAEGLGDDVRRDCLETLGGESSRVMEWARRAGLRSSDGGETVRIATEAELTGVASLKGVTLGAHSWSHPNLVRCAEADLRHELSRTMQWLEERFGGQARKWLAYPYGLNDAAVRRSAAGAGYEAAFTITGGWYRRPQDPFAIPRLNVPAGLSTGGLAARLNGFLAG